MTAQPILVTSCLIQYNITILNWSEAARACNGVQSRCTRVYTAMECSLGMMANLTSL